MTEQSRFEECQGRQKHLGRFRHLGIVSDECQRVSDECQGRPYTSIFSEENQ